MVSLLVYPFRFWDLSWGKDTLFGEERAVVADGSRERMAEQTKATPSAD